ncbi:hypothetical protein ACHAXN_002432 [Cyclotella atomus]
MGNTESTTDMQMSTTSSDAPATTNTHNNLLHDEEDQNEDLIEAHLVEEDEENTIYDGTLELPWWRQRRIKILIYVICILLLLMAALLAAFLGNNTLSSLLFSLAEISTPAPTKSLFPSSSPHISPNICFQNKSELEVAIQLYIEEDCTANKACEAGKTYGWPIGIWCVSRVKDMSGLFQNAPDFNEDLWWDTSSVTTMKRMFQGAKSFNQDLSDWDVSSVTDMSYMFHRSLSFKATLVLGTHPV